MMEVSCVMTMSRPISVKNSSNPYNARQFNFLYFSNY